MGYLQDFKGEMHKDSVDASIYAVFRYFFFRGFLYKYTTGSAKGENWHSAESRIQLLATDAFGDFYQRMIIDISTGAGHFDQDMICGGMPYQDLGSQPLMRAD